MKKIILISLLLNFALICSSQYSITGTVLNSQNTALPGATVTLVNTLAGVSTDLNGKFTLEVPTLENAKVKFSYIGYKDVIKEFTSTNNSNVQVILEMDRISLAEVKVASSVVSMKTPIAHSHMSEKEIEQLNFGQDLPYLLRMQPSVVTTSDAGTGIGYTGMRIRGSDASRINVTINGIPLNDSESQGVFWVNMPDFGSSVNSIQIQRGVGTSTNGAGAFGGTVNLQTTRPQKSSYFGTSLATGSYGTSKTNMEFSTGILDNKWNLNGRLSKIDSDGYIDRSFSDLSSLYLNGGLYLDNTTVQFMLFKGHERTYQSWYGTPESVLLEDEEGLENLASNVFFMDDEDRENLFNSGRTYNYYTYENEVDNYNQDHYQLHLTHLFNPYVRLNVSGHYTYGRGYFEQFRKDDDLTDYGINPVVLEEAQIAADGTDENGVPTNSEWGQNISNPNVSAFMPVALNSENDTIFDTNGNALLNAYTAITSGDFIRRRWLDNDFYGAVWALNYRKNQIDATLGGGINTYKGDHFGRVVWSEHNGGYVPSNNPDANYYFSDAQKNDFNIYTKATYQVNQKLNGFVDLQVRKIGYETQGVDNDLREINADESWTFFNPKIGATYVLNNNERYYASFSVGNREPVRSDIIDSPSGEVPKHETLYDFEAGYYFLHPVLSLNVNVFYMNYENQLVLTGALNDVGSPIRTNVASSFRRGVEFIGGWNINSRFSWKANLSLSQNRIKKFTETVSDIISTDFENTDISFSPSVVAGSDFSYSINRNRKKFSVHLLTKYVGKQYLDNTSNENKIIDSYFVNDLILRQSFQNFIGKEFGISLAVNNILSADYSSNGYTYSYAYQYSDGTDLVTHLEEQNAYYPQAPINFLLQLDVRF